MSINYEILKFKTYPLINPIETYINPPNPPFQVQVNKDQLSPEILAIFEETGVKVADTFMIVTINTTLPNAASNTPEGTAWTDGDYDSPSKRTASMVWVTPEIYTGIQWWCPDQNAIVTGFGETTTSTTYIPEHTYQGTTTHDTIWTNLTKTIDIWKSTGFPALINTQVPHHKINDPDITRMTVISLSFQESYITLKEKLANYIFVN